MAKKKEETKSIGLESLRPPRGSRKRKVRVGRGMGSKLGKTSGAGNKGQKSRKGFSRRPGFEGGQMPLHRRIPKRGQHSLFRREFAVVNVQALNAFAAGDVVNAESLAARGLLRSPAKMLKILGEGELKAALTVRAHAFIKSAEEKIAQAGRKVEKLSCTSFWQRSAICSASRICASGFCSRSGSWRSIV